MSGVVYVVSVRSKLLRGHQRCRLSCNPYHVFGPTGPSFWPVVILYVADLADIAAQYNLTLHAFAGDNQLYIHCKPENVQSAVTSVQQCVSAIEQWMAASRLRLNMDKTELIWTGTKHNLSKIPGSGRAFDIWWCSRSPIR